jgi:hypothetical protein
MPGRFYGRCSASAGARKLGSARAAPIKQLEHSDFLYEYTLAFHDGVELGPAMLAKIAKRTGLKPEDL